MQQTRCFLVAALVAGAAAPLPLLAQKTADVPPPVERVEIVVPDRPVFVGTSLDLGARVWVKGDSTPRRDARVFWEASNLTGAWVTPGGTVLFYEPGDMNIVARSGGVSTTRRITVKPNPVHRIEVVGAPEQPVDVGDTIRFSANLAGRWREAISDAHPNWAVAVGSDATYGTGARITPDGKFTASRPGAYTVIAEMNGRADVAQVIVRGEGTVAPAPASHVEPARRIEIPEPAAAPYAGTTLPLRASIRSLVTGEPIYGANVTWSSSDPSVADIAADGALALRRPGRATITVDHQGEKATRTIRVVPNPAGRIVLRSNTRDAAPGTTVMLRADIWAPGAQLIRDARPNIAVIAHDASETDVVPAVDGDGRFVPAKAGVYTVIAEMGGLASRTTITVRDPAFGDR